MPDVQISKRSFISYLIHDVQLLTAGGRRQAVSLAVKDGVVEDILVAEGLDLARWPKEAVIAGNGMTLIPAGVDPQVHMRVPGQPHKETARTCLRSALHGGVGALLTMPNTKPVIDEATVVKQADDEIKAVRAEYPVSVLVSAALSLGQRGQATVDFRAMMGAGIRFFTDDGVGVASDDLMRDIFRAGQELGFTVLQHAEIPGHGGVLAPSPVQASLGIKAYDEKAEVDMVDRDLRLLEEFPGARYHVLHVSCRSTVEKVAAAKRRGLRVTCEVSPHHLFFAGDDIDAANSSFKMNPPLRSPEDRDFLKRALQDGSIDFVATDHAPHEPEMKTVNFKTAAFGTVGLDTALPVLWTLVQRGELSAQRMVEVFSRKPAEFLGLATATDGFGDIAVGRPLRAALFESLPAPRPWGPEELFSLSKNSCFIGSPLAARVRATMIGGDVFSF